MKTQKLIKLILKWGIFATGAVLAIIYFIPGTEFHKIWSYVATMALPFAMDILRFFGIKISDRFEIAYLVFVIPAMVLGIDFDIYKVILPFDKIVHSASGVLAAFGAREIIDQASGSLFLLLLLLQRFGNALNFLATNYSVKTCKSSSLLELGFKIRCGILS